jgi:hypothetical protein
LARFRESNRSADVELAVGAPTPAQVRRLVEAPGVAAVATSVAYAIIIPKAPDFQAVRMPSSPSFGHTVDRDRLVAGRAPDPSSADQITVGEGFANRLHLRVGDRLDAASYSPRQVAAVLGGVSDVGAFAGPHLRLLVVGIVRRPLDLGERGATGGLLLLTPAFGRTYHGRVGVFGDGVRVRTKRGERDVPRVLAASRQIFGDSLFNAQSLALETQGASNAIRVLTLALWAAVAVAALAGAFAIGTVLTREILLAGGDDARLRELGCTRRQRVLALAAPGLIVVAVGSLLALVGAVALSPLFPVGVARLADPSVGWHSDWVVLGVGVVGVATAIAGIASVAALQATRPPADSFNAARLRKSSRVAERAAIAGLAPTATNGLRFAFDRGRSRTAIPIRSAYIGTVAGIVGLVAVCVFASSLDHLATTPRLSGTTWQFATIDRTANTPCGAGSYGLPRIRGIDALAEVCTQNVAVQGRIVTALAFTPLTRVRIGPEIVAGRAPRRDREVALGAKTLHALDKSVGDLVEITNRGKRRDYRIVGRAVFPSLEAAQPLADGAAFTGAGYAPLFDQNLFQRYFVGRFSDDAEPAVVTRHIAGIHQLGPVTTATVPVEIERLHQIDWLPIALAGFLAALALIAIGHALITSVRQRRHELALLKTFGFTRHQLRSTIAWQATSFAAVGLAIGIPLGVVVGTTAWRVVANGLGVAVVQAVPILLLSTTVIGVFVAVNLIALVPAHTAATTEPAIALRTE